MLHFIGFRGEEFLSAIRIWGQPDFIHKWHDSRMWGDIDTDNDTIIWAGKADPDHCQQYTWQDHENW